MKTIKNLGVYILVFTLAIALLIFQIHHHRQLVQAAMNGKGDIFAQHKEAFDSWQNLSYAPIDSPSEIADQLKLAKTVISADITPQMHSQLIHDFSGLIMIYQSKNQGQLYTDYVRARTPVACDISSEHLQHMAERNHLAANATPLEIMKANAQASGDAKQFAGLCGAASTIVYSEVQKSSSPDHCLTCTEVDLAHSLPQRKGYLTFRKWFEFQEDFGSQYDADQPVKVAVVTLLAKGQVSQVAERLVTRLVWCPKSHEWRPFEQVKDTDDQDLQLMLP